MKAIYILISFVLLGTAQAQAQIKFDKMKDKAKAAVQGKGKGLSNDEIISGLKEALSIGSNNAAGFASKLDGFNKNQLIRIPFPPDAEKMKNKLSRVPGMNSKIEEFETTLNRAAEEAALSAANIFVNAVKSMLVSDGLSILNGVDSAATLFLRDKTSAQLRETFQPIVKAAIDKVEVTKYWTPLVNTYSKMPLAEPVNPNLEEYVTDRAMLGLFKLLMIEEQKIRQDPAAQVTDLLKKVFGKG